MEYSIIYTLRRLTADERDGSADDARGHLLQQSAPLSTTLGYQRTTHYSTYAAPTLLQKVGGVNPEG